MTGSPTEAAALSGGPAAPLRLLLIAGPEEFDPYRSRDEDESDREFMIRQARTVIEAEGGAGWSVLSAEEYQRIKTVWIDGRPAAAVRHFSKPVFAEIRRVETMLIARPLRGM